MMSLHRTRGLYIYDTRSKLGRLGEGFGARRVLFANNGQYQHPHTLPNQLRYKDQPTTVLKVASSSVQVSAYNMSQAFNAVESHMCHSLPPV
jgi:hypothetical protein